jgi:hypothetical protein
VLHCIANFGELRNGEVRRISLASETTSGPAAGLVDDPDEVVSFAADTAFASLSAIPRSSFRFSCTGHI